MIAIRQTMAGVKHITIDDLRDMLDAKIARYPSGDESVEAREMLQKDYLYPHEMENVIHAAGRQILVKLAEMKAREQAKQRNQDNEDE